MPLQWYFVEPILFSYVSQSCAEEGLINSPVCKFSHVLRNSFLGVQVLSECLGLIHGVAPENVYGSKVTVVSKRWAILVHRRRRACVRRISFTAIAAGGRRLLGNSQGRSRAWVPLLNLWASTFSGVKWTGAEFRDKGALWRSAIKWETPLVIHYYQ